MEDEIDIDTNDIAQDAEMEASTIHKIALEAMLKIISRYLELSEETNAFQDLNKAALVTREDKQIIIEGYRFSLNPSIATKEDILEERIRQSAILIDTEKAITGGVYEQIRTYSTELVNKLFEKTSDLTNISARTIMETPELLPFYQQLAGFRSKSELKKGVGAASDTKIPSKAASKLEEKIKNRLNNEKYSKEKLKESVEGTFEGIVRDLVGKILLESIVVNALERAQIPFKREGDYIPFKGVLDYTFRADFVIPDSDAPKVFIEVRKSSTRHASLYAKDKMFSAINWKGKHQDLLGILIVEGPWTQETLRVMADVFDYVIPLPKASMAAEAIKEYLDGDASKLKWLITFKIERTQKQ